MTSVHDRQLLALALLLLGADKMVAQPLCDVLLRPAFHYTTEGLTVHVVDSSMTYGLETDSFWDFGDGATASSNPAHTYAGPGTYRICLTLTTTQGAHCSATYCRDVVVPVNNCPLAQDVWFSSANSLTNTGQFTIGSGLEADSWIWEFGDGTSSTDIAPSHTWPLPGPHFVALTLRLGDCWSSHGQWVGVDGNGSTCGPDLFVDFTAELNGATAHFQPNLIANGVLASPGIWSYGDGNIDTALASVHSYAAPGRYQVCYLVGALDLASQDTCFSLVCKTIEVNDRVGLGGAFSRVGSLTVWPNPTTNGAIELRWSAPTENAHILVSDALGRSVWTKEQQLFPATTLHFEGLARGQYLLTVTTAHERYVQWVHFDH